MRLVALIIYCQVALGLFALDLDQTLLSRKHTNAVRLAAGPNDANIAKVTARILAHQHYLKQPFNDEISSRFLDRYLDALDNSHLYFLQSDVKEFESYRAILDDLTYNAGDTTPARVIFLRFLERLEQQYHYVTGLLKTEKFEFAGEDRYIFNRKTLPRPADMAEARNLWRDRLRYEYLQEKLNVGKPEVIGQIILEKLNQRQPETIEQAIQDKLSKEKAQQIGKMVQEKWGKATPEEITKSILAGLEQDNAEEIVKIITRRYTRVLRALQDYDNDDVLQVYLTALTRVYDPHSDYMGKAESDNFAISMKLSLFGIGALLRSEDGYCKIQQLMPGPAQKSKKIKPNDKIIAVAQGDQEPVDVVEMPLRKVVELIRGPKGTEVRLTIIPADAPDPSVRETVSLIRDKIKLEDQEAKARLIDLPAANGQVARLGVIDLPSFYSEMEFEGRKQGENDPATFSAGDLRDYLGAFAVKLAKHTDPVSQFLWDRFSETTRLSLSEFVKKHGRDAEGLELALSQELNTVVQGASIYQEQRFGGVKVSREARRLLRPNISEEELIRLNRLLLQDAYPQELSKSPKSTTVDVARLLKKLIQEKVSGVVLDLRRNGGGSLEEAIKLTGLFIKEGPIVQVKGPVGEPIVDYDPDPAVAYDGPLVVLTSRFSASASEILASALQDYGRALIVGDSSTHGKGTVQSLIRLEGFLRQSGVTFTNNPGDVKVTIRMFYRINGSSTQLEGVKPDIVLPSLNNHLEVGEKSLDNPLLWEPIPSAPYKKLNRIEPHLAALKKRSEERVDRDKDFAFIREEIERYQKTAADKSVSLNEAQRLKEKKEADERLKARKSELVSRPELADKVYEITLRQVDLPGLPQPMARTNELTKAETSAPLKFEPTLKPAELKKAQPAQEKALEPKPQVAQKNSTFPVAPRSEGGSQDDDSEENAPTVDPALDEAKRVLSDLVSLSEKERSLAITLPEKAK